MRPYLPEVFLQRALTTQLFVRGYQVREEVLFGNTRFDTIAFDGETIIGFEVKLNSWRRAINQSRIYKLCCDKVYVVVPAHASITTISSLCKANGLGLATIGRPPDWKFNLVLEAPRSTLLNGYHHQSIQRIAAFK